MIQNEKKDPLRDLNWSSVYSDVPEDFEPLVHAAFRRIRTAEIRRKNGIRLVACAAAVAAVACIALLRMGRREFAPDQANVVLTVPSVITMDTPVFSTKDDPFLHLDGACPKTLKGEVELRLVTALEFEKTPCPSCCTHVQFEK